MIRGANVVNDDEMFAGDVLVDVGDGVIRLVGSLVRSVSELVICR